MPKIEIMREKAKKLLEEKERNLDNSVNSKKTSKEKEKKKRKFSKR